MFGPLAEYLARRFAGRGEPLADLIQVADVALIKAVDRFDPGRGVKFSTYATATIVGELKRHFRDKSWAVRVPRRLQEVGLQVSRVSAELLQELGRSPRVAEIAVRTGLSDEDILEGMEVIQAYTATSLDAPGDEDDSTLLERLGAEDERLALVDGWVSVAPLLRDLPERERRVIHMRFFKAMTQTQIAEVLGISQMHVSRLLSQTLADLRRAAVSRDEGPAASTQRKSTRPGRVGGPSAPAQPS